MLHVASEKLPVRHLKVQNFLSLRDISVQLGALNVLVGPNGGGKSNFLSVFRFLGEVARTDLVPALQSLFGGYESVRFRAISSPSRSMVISIQGEVTEFSSPTALDEYHLRIVGIQQRGRVVLRREETLLLKRSAGRGRRITLKGAKYEFETVTQPRRGSGEVSARSERAEGEIESDASALSVLRRIGRRHDTQQVNELAEVFEDLRLFDPSVELARQPFPPEGRIHLNADASNLAPVLAYMRQNTPEVLEAIEDDMRIIMPGFQTFKFEPVGGSMDAVRVDIVERGLSGATPMARASFGTVRAIALFAMLRDPDPPRLTCLEEVDHGLHPHALDILVERLREASSRTQIIIATHSPALVNRIGTGELLIFERDFLDASTRVLQPDPSELDAMKKQSGYELGELWFSGMLGGGLNQ